MFLIIHAKGKKKKRVQRNLGAKKKSFHKS